MSVVGLAGCSDEPPAVSIEQAKKTAAAFPIESKMPEAQAMGLIAPPRAISDILAIFDQANETPPDELEQHRKTSALIRPPRADNESLALFYRNRHLARRYLGQVGDALLDARKALEYYEKTQDYQKRRLGDIRYYIGQAELEFGNYRNSLEHFKQSLADRKTMGRYARLVLAYVRSGDLNNARKFKSEGDAFADERLENPQLPSRGILSIKLHQARMARRIHASSGEWKEAEKFQRRVLQLTKLDPKVRSRSLIYAGNTLSSILRKQDRFIESEIVQRENVRLALRTYGKNHPDTATMVQNLARVMNAQGRFADAGRLLNEVEKINRLLRIPPNSRLHGSSLRLLASNLVLREKWREATNIFVTLRENQVSNRALKERWFSSNVYFPLALIKVGRAKEAETLLRSMLANSKGPRTRRAEKKALLGMALHAQGRLSEAYAEFHEAIGRLVARNSTATDNENITSAREWRLRQYLNSYIDLLSVVQNTPLEKRMERPAAEEAFRLAELARSSAVHKAIAAAGLRAVPANAALSGLIRREQNISKQEEALLGLLINVASSAADQQDPKVVRTLQINIAKLRAQSRDLSKTIANQFPDYAKLVNPPPSTAAAVARSLRADEALIATYTTDKKTYIWALRKSGRLAFAAMPAGTTQISRAVKKLRLALNPSVATLGGIPAYDVAAAHELYRTILAPVRDSWNDAKRLLTVLHGSLGQVPLSLLVTEAAQLDTESGALFSNYRDIPWLLRTHAVTALPSVSSLAVLRNLPKRNPAKRSFAGFADPWFSVAQANAASRTNKPIQTAALSARGALALRRHPIRLRSTPRLDAVSSANLAQLPRLPDTAREIHGMATAMKADLGRDIFTGRKASEGQVKSMKLSNYRVLAFATHGLVPGDLDGLSQPALALSSQRVVGGVDDGLLTMGEIFGLKLDADWVVLSACNTASGNGAGAEAVSGLGRAFFYAGTRALLVSNWPVETTSARALTTDIFERQAKNPSLSRAEALRQSMRNLIDKGGLIDAKGNMVFSYAHPIFWAPFSLVGDGGGGTPAS